MFYSLVQTIVCVLLIQAGIYALHLNGPSANSNGASLGSNGGIVGVNAPTSHGGSGAAQLNAAVNTNQMLNILSANQHAQHLHAGGSGSGSGGGGGIGLSRTLSNSAVNPLDNAGRLSQELADRAQLERERLMLLGLAKQTALANSGTGHHGRPIITGRIQMSPVDDVESDYSSLLLPQTRGPLYGNVVKEPAAVENDEYVDEEQREYDRARLANGAHRKYEYGRIVEPAEHEVYAEPQPIDELDELIEAEPEMDDVLSDLESYQYLDELLPPEHRSLWGDDGLGYGIAGGNSRPHHLNDGFPLLLNPYRTLEELENSPSHTLQEIFEKESHDKAETKAHRQHASHPTREQQKQQQQQQQQYEQQQQQQQARHQQSTQPQQQYTFSGGVKHRNAGGYGGDYNNKMQQKWQRKRSQQQQQQRQLQQWQRNIFGQQLKQQQLHHFGAQPQRHNKLSLANSEATATKHIPLNGSTNDLNNNSNNKLSSALNALATQQQSSSAPKITSGDAAMKSDQLQHQQRQQQQQQQEQDEPRQIGKVSTADVASPATGLSKAAAKLKAQQQQQQQHKKQQTPSQKQDSFLHPNRKRSGSVGGVGAANGMSAAAAAAATNGYSSIASQLMLRTARGQRQYDVPQIECPTAMDGMERFACPTPDVQGRYRCIDDHVLCDGFIDCPEGEDEDRRSCMFYKTVKAHLDVLADALLRWARGR